MKNKLIYFVSYLICISLMVSCSISNIRNLTLKSETNDAIMNIDVSFWEPSIKKDLETAFVNIASEYNKINPNVKINLLVEPVNGYQEWIKVRLASGNMPDIEYNYPSEINKQIKSGLIENLEYELNLPNPYSESGNLWKYDFDKDKINSNYKDSDAVNMQTHSIPILGLGLAYYYNESIYEKLGLHPPTTWDEMLSNFQQIEQVGINPVSLMGQKVDAVDWISWEICTGLYSEKFLNDTKLNSNFDGRISNYEFFKAVESGYYDVTKQGEFRALYVQYLETLKEYGKYCHNASGLDEIGAKAQFLSGKSAHIFTGSWDCKSFLLNENIPFKVGTFPFPKFKKENSKYADDTMTIVSLQPIAVTKAVNKIAGKRQVAIDFMQFLTAPKYYGKFIDDAYNIPVVSGIKTNPIFKSFTGGTKGAVLLYSLDKVSSFNSYGVNLSMLAQKTVNIEALLDDVQKSLKNAAKTYFEENEQIIEKK